ncbi:MAG: cytochrome c/FTR1 family iron permease [Gemmatimonadaceae bacterium]
MLSPIDSLGMRLRSILIYRCGAALALLSLAWGGSLRAQERPAKRIASIVGVAVEEYGKGIDAKGNLISQQELDEAISFLGDARDAASRLSGGRADSARVALDSLVRLMGRHAPPSSVGTWHERFVEALGEDAALDLPTRPIDLAAGRATYESQCARCHGATGQGDGPDAKGLNPKPPPLGNATAMRDRTPAIQYRIVSVGVSGTPMAAFGNALTPDDRWDVVWYLQSMRGTVARPAPEGEGLFIQRCAACHGAGGGSDGPMSAALGTLPAELSSFGWQSERSDAQLAQAIRAGVAGTSMPGARDLTEPDVEQLVRYVRLLALRDSPLPRVATDSATDAAVVARRVMMLLDDALAQARAGKKSDASDRAFDAYIAFEPLETPARAKSPGMVGAMERHFADFKGAIKATALRDAESSRNAIEAGLPGIVDLTKPPKGAWGAFFQSLLIIVREGFEAILVIGAIVAFLLKTGHRERLRSIWWGVGGALAASALTAVALATLLSAVPASGEIIEGVTLLVAVGVLFSVSYWLISKVEAAKWQQFIREKVNTALEHGGGKALAFVAFLAVYREGAETALFYQALFHEGGALAGPLALGIVIGAVILSVIFVLFYRYGVRIPLRPFFAVTSALLYYMAFVFMGKGVRELQEGDVVSITVLPGWPHVDAMGIFPSVETLLAQLVLLGLFVFALLKTFWPSRAVALPTMPADAVAQERVDAIRERLADLEQRVSSIEQGISDGVSLHD